MGRLAKQLSGQYQGNKVCKAKGGAVKHDDVKEDKALISAELKKRGLKKGGKCK